MQKTTEIYDLRNTKKKEIEFGKTKNIDVKIGEFWRYREGMNIGNEISKDGSFKRPCIILQNNLGNGLLLVAPITTKYHNWMKKYYININNPEKYGLKEAWIIINQIRLIDHKRLIHITGKYNPNISFANIIIDAFILNIKKIASK